MRSAIICIVLYTVLVLGLQRVPEISENTGSKLDSRVRIHPATFSDPYIIIVVCNHDQFRHVKIYL